MIDLVLLRSSITVVDTGNFIRAVKYLYLMQPIVSQQILRLEQQLGCRLLGCSQHQVLPMGEGDRLLGYAHRLLYLANEASEALSSEYTGGVLRLGVLESLGSSALIPLIVSSAREHPQLRLEVEGDLSHHLLRLHRNGDLDMLLVRQQDINSDCHTRQAKPVYQTDSAGRPHTLPFRPSQPSLPLVVSPVSALYRQEILYALESVSQSQRITYSGPNLASPCVAVSVGLGVSLLPASTVQAGHHVLGAIDGFPEVSGLELVLFARPNLDSAGCALRDRLVEICAACVQTLQSVTG